MKPIRDINETHDEHVLTVTNLTKQNESIEQGERKNVNKPKSNKREREFPIQLCPFISQVEWTS